MIQQTSNSGREASFSELVAETQGQPLRACGIELIQVNVGFRCNQTCNHCHIEASPRRSEQMPREVMEAVIAAARSARVGLVDVTGGAPELNPHLEFLVRGLAEVGIATQVRTNLTALIEPDCSHLPAFFKEYRVKLVGSLPCYMEENVDGQRGPGTYARSIEALRMLNRMGYGVEGGLELDLVYNPTGPVLPPAQGDLEQEYRRELDKRFGISFTHLLTITNMPLGRFLSVLESRGELESYRRLLRKSFNPETVEGLMCRHQVSVDWRGRLYDCDFNLILDLPVDGGAPRTIFDFDTEELARRRIVTGDHCFGCTAGCGSSCRGALV